MEVIILPTAEEASEAGARLIARQVREKPDSVLGLATGSTPTGVYAELVRMHRVFDIAPTLAIPGVGRVSDLKARVSGDGIAVLEEHAG